MCDSLKHTHTVCAPPPLSVPRVCLTPPLHVTPSLSPHGLPAQPQYIPGIQQRTHHPGEAVQLPALLQQLRQQQQDVLQDVQHRFDVLAVHAVRWRRERHERRVRGGAGGEVRRWESVPRCVGGQWVIG